jgi:glucan phosphoethanolaminetransferase (alkaline phosphatase superfamily)
MKKTNHLLILFLALNCLFSTPISAFVFSQKNETSQIAPPQYKSSKMTIWQAKGVKRMAKMVKSADKPIYLTKQARKSVLFSLLAPVVFISFFIVDALLSPEIGLIFLFGWLLAIFMALFGIIKGGRVLRNEEATKKQRTTARIGQISGIVIGLLLVVFPILAYIAIINSGG